MTDGACHYCGGELESYAYPANIGSDSAVIFGEAIAYTPHVPDECIRNLLVRQVGLLERLVSGGESI